MESTINKKSVRTQFNHTSSKGRTFTSPSLTIPEDGLSIREILKSHTSGASPAIMKTPEYSSEDSPFAGMDVNKMDLIDLQNLTKHIVNLRTNAENEIKKRKVQHTNDQQEKQKIALEKAAVEHYKSVKGDAKQL